MEVLLAEIRKCTVCEPYLAAGCRPVLSGSPSARLLIIGQAPGTKVHASGVPWQDQSGKRLRQWLGMEEAAFYEVSNIAIVPMGFCYPGRGKSGDLPPRPECAPLWHPQLLEQLPNIRLTLLIGQYAQKYYLPDSRKKNLTETVRHFREYLPDTIPLPHPSPRNGFWLRKNPWFAEELLPVLKQKVKAALAP